MGDGLPTGSHEPEASHLGSLRAVTGSAAVERGYEEAVRGRYAWQGFGDARLVLPEEAPHAERCDGNGG